MELAGDNVHPWDALLMAVRLASYHTAAVDRRLAALRDDPTTEEGDLLRWQSESRRERALMAKTAKAAIDAGIAERLVRQVELDGRLVAAAVVAALDALALDQDQRTLALEAAHARLAVDQGV